MKASIKTSAYAIAVSIALLACDDTGTNSTNNTGLNSVSSSSDAQSSSSFEIPDMDSRVVSYKAKVISNDKYIYQQLGYEGCGFTTDEVILKLWFPNIFNDEQSESECNYFALYGHRGYPFESYLIFSQDMTLYRIACTWKEPPEGEDGSLGFYEAMLICDDKAGTLKGSIDFGYMHIYEEPNWDCKSGAGRPNENEVYF